MACDRTEWIQRLHDGELSPAERVTTEAHLRECRECAAAREDWRKLSALIVAAARSDAPAGLCDRVMARRRSRLDRSVIRIAGWLTGAAAAVLVTALWMRPAARDEAVLRPAVWEIVAVTPPPESADDASIDIAVTAQWMAEGLSLARNGDVQ